MPDDERTRRRLGDATKNRIDSLASGWSVEPDTSEPPEPVAKAVDPVSVAPAPASNPPARKKPRTNPPPPPGSEARKALEQAIVETKPETAAARPPSPKIETRSPSPKIETRPPSPKIETAPAERPKTATNPPAPKVATNPPSPPADRPKVATKPPPIPPQRPKTPSGAPIVPIGEFDGGGATIDEDKLRVAFAQQMTMKRDAAEALLQLPQQPLTVVTETPVEVLLGETAEKLRGDPTISDPSTKPFERGDPTSQGRDDATEIEPPSRLRSTKGGTLRTVSALRRKRGIGGDVRYVFTALFGVRSSRRELAELEERQHLRQTSRRRHLVTLGRTAVTADAFDHPALGKAREALQEVEEERSKHAGAVAASDAELERVRRDRETKAKQAAGDLAAAETELADLAKKLEPLEKEATAARKRAAELAESLRRIAKTIADTEAQLVSVKGDKMDRAEIQAEIATLKADRSAIQRDEPVIAAELDALNPRIAAIDAARSEAENRKAEVHSSEAEDLRRTAELVDAIGAKRKVVERAAADAETARDRVLFELGDRLYVDRPAILGAQMSPVDQIDLELGQADRRIMELREILSSIDRAKIVRGALVILLTVAAMGTIVAWLLYLLL